MERDAPYLALSAVDAAADAVRARFAEAARTTAEVAAKKTRALLTPFVSSLHHTPKFRRAGFRGAERALADVAADATLAEAATAALRRAIASEGLLAVPAAHARASSSGIEVRDEDESPRAFRSDANDATIAGGASGGFAVERRGRDEDDEDDVDDVDDEDDVDDDEDDDEDVDADEDGARTRPAANEARPPPPRLRASG